MNKTGENESDVSLFSYFCECRSTAPSVCMCFLSLLTPKMYLESNVLASKLPLSAKSSSKFDYGSRVPLSPISVPITETALTNRQNIIHRSPQPYQNFGTKRQNQPLM